LLADTSHAQSEILRISTDRWSVHERIALWRETLEQHMLRLDLEPVPNMSLHADLTLYMLPYLKLVIGTEGGIRQWRSRKLIADANDDLFLIVSLQGSTIVSQRGCEIALAEEEATIWSAGEIGGFVRPRSDRFMALCIPRAAIASLVPRLDDAIMQRIPRSSMALQLLMRYITFLQDKKRALSECRSTRLFVKHVHELVAATITAHSPESLAGGQGVRAARLAAIQADILASLAQVRLSPKTIANRYGVTARYVHLLFQETGKTFCEFVEQERLNRAQALLIDPAYSAMPISEIASQVGFAEPSTFHRAFRRRFGDTPGRLRRAVSC
jgi:AraC-like DNA-binding protein